MKFHWLMLSVVRAMHQDVIRHYGGAPGVRDEAGLESALARPLNIAEYEPKASAGRLAAAYALGIIRNHPFIDGNKRIGLLCLLVFLERNGFKWKASEAEETVMVLRAAAGEIDETSWTKWVEDNVERN